jgi:soluble lytic murein transglycosylase-like protein
MRKRRHVMSGTLAAVAVTGLTVKAALASPLGALAAPQLDRLKESAERLVMPSRARSSTGTDRPMVASSSQPPAGVVVANAAQQTGRRYIAPQMRAILRDAAQRHQVDPRLVLALSYWESGWDQSRVSESGAVGLMQVEPSSADEAGPALLGRTVDITDPYDNADVGVAIFREDLDAFGNPAMALAAYYQGPSSLRQDGMLQDTQAYVDGILALAGRIR